MEKASHTATINVSSLHAKIDRVTAGQQPWINQDLKERIPAENAAVICDYLIAMQNEINPTLAHRRNLLTSMILFSEKLQHKPFKEMTREDVLGYLDAYRKTEEADPLHKWIGTYNLRRAALVKFFRWLYSPETRPDDRELPPVVAAIYPLRRKEESIYKPTDLWTEEDDLLFLKYCPHKMIKCYHMMARDSSARPHELLKVKIREVVFKNTPTAQYAEIVISGKTTQRSIPLFESLPYLKDWLDEHPLRNNPDAPLFSSSKKHLGKPLTPNALYTLYAFVYNKGVNDKRKGFYEGYFRRLLKNPAILPE